MRILKLFCPRIPLHSYLFLVLAIVIVSPLVCTKKSDGVDLPTLDFGGRPTDIRPDLLENNPRTAPPRVKLPQRPPAVQTPESRPDRSVYIRQIAVTGSTAFSPEEISEITSGYENRRLTMVDIESLRRELTLLYVNQGYINSGAVLPDQEVTNGLLSLQIVEGKIAKIEITGNKWFKNEYLSDRLALDAGTPVNIIPLQNRLQLLQQDNRIRLLHAELLPGDNPGQAELQVDVEENSPISTWVALNNYQSPSVGAERGLFNLTDQNLTGIGDIFSFTYGYSSGISPILDIWYAVPVSVQDTTLIMRYWKNDSGVVDDEFGPLDIESTSESYELSLRHPLYRSLSQEFALALTVAYEKDKTSLMGEPFSFAPGVDNGTSKVVPVRFSQDWTYRTQQQVFAARSRFSYGTKAMDATRNNHGDIPDGQFFSWLGQIQWARKVNSMNLELLARTDLQYASKSLLPVEQIAIGGRYSVRGYRENLLVRDEAVIASVEARVALLQDERWADYWQLIPFFDYGRGTNVDTPTFSPKEIYSAGLGMRWGVTPDQRFTDTKIEAEIYWGYPLKNVETGDDDIQDDGICFQLALTMSF